MSSGIEEKLVKFQSESGLEDRSRSQHFDNKFPICLTSFVCFLRYGRVDLALFTSRLPKLTRAERCARCKFILRYQ